MSAFQFSGDNGELSNNDESQSDEREPTELADIDDEQNMPANQEIADEENVHVNPLINVEENVQAKPLINEVLAALNVGAVLEETLADVSDGDVPVSCGI